MTVALTIPFYWAADPERGECTRKVFAHYQRVADLGIDVYGVGSEQDISRDLFCRYFPEANYVEFPQSWVWSPSGGRPELRRKFDACIEATRTADRSQVFIQGSDDLLTVEFFRHAMKSQADLVGVGGGATGGTRIVRLCTGEVVEWRGGYNWGSDLLFVGGILGLSRRLLDAWDWQPFSEPNDEVGVERRARDEGFTLEAFYGDRDGFVCWNVKTETALNKWDYVRKYNLRPAPDAVRTSFRTMWEAL